MPEPQPTPDPHARALTIEREILYLLTDPDSCQPLWTIEDLAREFDQHDITAYTRPLEASGLLHSTSDGHVFASRAAVRHIQIVGHGVG